MLEKDMEISNKVRIVLFWLIIFVALPWIIEPVSPALVKYASFLVDIAISLMILYPLYEHTRTKRPAMVSNEKIEETCKDEAKLKKQIMLERVVCIFCSIVFFGVSISTLVLAA